MSSITFSPCHFSTEMHLGASPGGDEGVPTLEDITDEETEVKLRCPESK